MNWFIKWGVKKYLLQLINELLSKYKSNVQTALTYIDLGIAKTERVLTFLKSTRAKLEDNKIDDEESDAIVSEGTELINGLLK